MPDVSCKKKKNKKINRMESKYSVIRALYECEQRHKCDTPRSDHSWVQLGGKRTKANAFLSSSHFWNYIMFINIAIFVPEVSKGKCFYLLSEAMKNAVKMLFMSSWNVWLCFHLFCCSLTMHLSFFFFSFFLVCKLYTYGGNADHFRWQEWIQMKTILSKIQHK